FSSRAPNAATDARTNTAPLRWATRSRTSITACASRTRSAYSAGLMSCGIVSCSVAVMGAPPVRRRGASGGGLGQDRCGAGGVLRVGLVRGGVGVVGSRGGRGFGVLGGPGGASLAQQAAGVAVADLVPGSGQRGLCGRTGRI